jgi:hypothetical protein
MLFSPILMDRRARAMILAFAEVRLNDRDYVIIQQDFIITRITEKISLGEALFISISTRKNDDNYIGERYAFGCVHLDIRTVLNEYRHSLGLTDPLPMDTTSVRVVTIGDVRDEWTLSIRGQGTIYTFHARTSAEHIETSHDDFMKVLRRAIGKKILFFSYTHTYAQFFFAPTRRLLVEVEDDLGGPRSAVEIHWAVVGPS